MKIHLVSLGCAKNLVDSEMMLGRLVQAGWPHTADPRKADTIIINTCSFIESATNESIDTILEMAKFKNSGICRRLIVTGCLPERFREEIVDSLPEVDFFLGTGAFHEIEKAVKGPAEPSGCHLPDPHFLDLQDQETPRLLSSPHMAYLKIAEGCSRHCTYCIIPKLRGKQKSRPLENIVAEARFLISKGLKELILVAQDTTAYGNDLDPPVSLDQVLKSVADISDEAWVRLLYAHPQSIGPDVIQTVAAYRNICSYFDIPIQHASNRLLKNMGRNYTSDDLYRLYDKIRSFVPRAVLRTTVMVGFPGETDKDYKDLVNFVDEIRFDHLGVFVYSDSKDLSSHKLSGHIPEGVANDRYDRLMLRQSKISFENNQKHIGKVYDVLVETEAKKNLFTGRTFFQAPEVDGITYIHSEKLSLGAFAGVRVTDVLEYDLMGDIVCKT
ncbi:MAG: 30S ribosomal protein S12 methylthiotransferase RimO [Candidatus Desulfatibia sp.]|uniref:30S ribosomal protein S12 methylthiotransferase RimO n=1 Tax=Candidatus Desulfatibia sp. TaxID=3101189 RepID=UPI002F2CE499